MANDRPARVSVLFPTFRFDATARQNLAAIATLGGEDIEVLIADNSVDQEKWSFLERLQSLAPNVHIFRHPENIGAHRNYLFLVGKATGEFCCLAADDDVLTADYVLAGAALASGADTAAASGLFIVLTPSADGAPAHLLRAEPRLEPTALERIAAYHSYNVLPYCVVRRTSLVEASHYVQANPLRASFMDYIGAYALLAQGKYRIDDGRPIYVYLNNNWSSEAVSWSTSARYYRECGLPETFQHFHSLAWSVALLHFFLSQYRPRSLPAAESETIATFLYDRYIADFREKHDRSPEVYRELLAGSPRAQRALWAFLTGPPAAEAQRFSQFLDILHVFSAPLAERYAAFLKTSLLIPAIADAFDAPAGNRAPHAAAAAENEALKAHIRALESSTSWRLTAPLRAAASLLPGRRRSRDQ